MKSKQILMSALIGFAMLATPIVASAKDHKGDGRNYSHQSESRSFNAGNKHEFRNQGGNGKWAAAPVAAAHRGWRNNYGNAYNYSNYGYNGYNGYYGNRGYYGGP